MATPPGSQMAVNGAQVTLGQKGQHQAKPAGQIAEYSSPAVSRPIDQLWRSSHTLEPHGVPPRFMIRRAAGCGRRIASDSWLILCEPGSMSKPEWSLAHKRGVKCCNTLTPNAPGGYNERAPSAAARGKHGTRGSLGAALRGPALSDPPARRAWPEGANAHSRISRGRRCRHDRRPGRCGTLESTTPKPPDAARSSTATSVLANLRPGIPGAGATDTRPASATAALPAGPRFSARRRLRPQLRRPPRSRRW
jgi:hypothetical protein